MMPAQFQVDIFDELRSILGGFEPVALSSVVSELEGLSRGKGRDGAAARCGLALTRECTIADSGDLESRSVDAQVIEYAAQKGCMVVTNDRRLREALLARGIGVITMRKHKKLELLQR